MRTKTSVSRAWLLCAIALAACGQSHALLDGDIDAASIARSCVEHLAAEEGAPCEVAWPCRDGSDGFCASQVATCEEGRVQHSFDAWVFSQSDGTSCPEGEATLEARGPGETLHFDRGAGSAESGFTLSMALLFASGTPFHECGRPRLTVMFVPNAERVYSGVLPAFGTLNFEGGARRVEGEVTIDSYGPDSGLLSGSLQLEGEGWTITGRMSLSVCNDLYRPSL